MTYSCEGDSGPGREYWQLPLGLMTNLTNVLPVVKRASDSNGLSAMRPGL